MLIAKIIMGYISISMLIAIIFLLSSKLFYLVRKRLVITWIEYPYILSSISLLIVLILRIFYKEEFSIIGEKSVLNAYIILQMLMAAFIAAILSFLAKPEERPCTLKVEILTGMSMEIPMRGLVQNLFVVFGATTVLYHSITLSIVLTAIIWVQFIIAQEIMAQRSLSPKIVLESIASMWFSLWVGIIYIKTGSIFVVMFTHGLQRWLAYMIRKIHAKRKSRGLVL